ncbi:MAG: metallophosphoesterase family protein [Candidatus Aenigmarchaeota archaeon]|nr:metallophosphoesterase family protein [Candidatus Aenigmarchaeota archaeon]
MAFSKEDVIRRMTEHKILVSPDALRELEKFTTDELGRIIDANRKKGTLALSDVMAYPAKAIQNFEILRNIESKNFTGSENIPNSYFIDKYDKMRQILSKKIANGAISVKNLPPRGEVHIIGMVRDVVENGEMHLVIEDATGSLNVKFAERSLLNECNVDDVIAVRAVIAGPQAFGKEIINPGVPVRPPSTGSGRALFVSDLHLDEAPGSVVQDIYSTADRNKADWVFIAGDVGSMKILEENSSDKITFVIPGDADSKGYPQKAMDTRKNNIISLSNPAIVKAGGMNILMCHDFRKEWLEKRHLGEPTTGIKNDFLCLDTVPDIVHCGHTHKPDISHYKSTTILNAGSALTELKPIAADFSERREGYARLQP